MTPSSLKSHKSCLRNSYRLSSFWKTRISVVSHIPCWAWIWLTPKAVLKSYPLSWLYWVFTLTIRSWVSWLKIRNTEKRRFWLRKVQKTSFLNFRSELTCTKPPRIMTTRFIPMYRLSSSTFWKTSPRTTLSVCKCYRSTSLHWKFWKNTLFHNPKRNPIFQGSKHWFASSVLKSFASLQLWSSRF